MKYVIIFVHTVQGQDPGFATIPPTILVVIGVTVGTPHGTLVGSDKRKLKYVSI